MRWSLVLTILLTAAAASARTVNVPVEYYRLPNGLKVVISEAHAAPTVTVAVYYGIGFRVEPKGRTGFAHLFEHMMFQGSANVKKMEHAKIVEANGGNLNGSTRLDFTKYFETLPSEPVEAAPERHDINEAQQTEEKRLKQNDKLANVPALAFGYHLPDQDSPDFPAVVLLDLILQGDDSSRFYQRLVKDKAISIDFAGGINFE